MGEDIKERYCSFKLSQRLKELGFDLGCHMWYDDEGTLNEAYYDDIISNTYTGSIRDDEGFVCVAPTLAIAREWVEKVYGIIVETRFMPISCYYTVMIYKHPWDQISFPIKKDYGVCISYESAMDKGLLDALWDAEKFF